MAQEMIDAAVNRVLEQHKAGSLDGDKETHFEDALRAELQSLALRVTRQKKSNDGVIDLTVFGIKEMPTESQKRELAFWPEGVICLELKAKPIPKGDSSIAWNDAVAQALK